jgi:hypothetical protein
MNEKWKAYRILELKLSREPGGRFVLTREDSSKMDLARYGFD